LTVRERLFQRGLRDQAKTARPIKCDRNVFRSASVCSGLSYRRIFDPRLDILPECFDTDSVNATFAQYEALAAEHINVLRRGAIHDKRFDDLVEKICDFDGICIVDTGATTFVPLWNYILENEILCLPAGRPRRVFVHSVVAGGQAMSDTLNGLQRLAETTTEKNVIV
jgi:hypothetical protein